MLDENIKENRLLSKFNSLTKNSDLNTKLQH